MCNSKLFEVLYFVILVIPDSKKLIHGLTLNSALKVYFDDSSQSLLFYMISYLHYFLSTFSIISLKESCGCDYKLPRFGSTRYFLFQTVLADGVRYDHKVFVGSDSEISCLYRHYFTVDFIWKNVEHCFGLRQTETTSRREYPFLSVQSDDGEPGEIVVVYYCQHVGVPLIHTLL